ncbi:MAG: response regulator, partial [Lentisphaeraceae bacterium]|nr:response regulator [Lentisphaeraceae bacterium]
MSISNRILIVDDDPTNRLFLKKGTAELPYEFIFASDGASALTKILNESFDLILLDVIMPGMSGFDVIRCYKEKFPESKTPFIFLTGRTDREAISEGFALGAVDYITKPFSLQEIRLRIATHHDLYKSHHELDRYAREMESLAEERAQQLLHADRLATLGTMAAGIMHEINNPTTFISGNVQVLQKKFLPLICDILKNSSQSENSKVKFMLEELPKMCDGILNGVSRITKITTGLKAFSGCRKNNLSKVDINDVINNSLLFCKGSLPARVNITVKQVSPAPMSYGDSQQLEQVLINLCINAGHAIENLKEP